jgi:hypothetical protein
MVMKTDILLTAPDRAAPPPASAPPLAPAPTRGVRRSVLVIDNWSPNYVAGNEMTSLSPPPGRPCPDGADMPPGAESA